MRPKELPSTDPEPRQFGSRKTKRKRRRCTDIHVLRRAAVLYKNTMHSSFAWCPIKLPCLEGYTHNQILKLAESVAGLSE